MNYHNILHDNMLNGDGLRVVLFLSGCDHKCTGCQNPQTHDPNSGLPFGVVEKTELFSYLLKPYTKGITLTGGDPFYKSNIAEVTELCCEIKKSFPTKDIWLYTGYTLENLPDAARKALEYIDVLVDGRYDATLADPALHYVGSANQRIIDVQKTLQENEIIIYKETK